MNRLVIQGMTPKHRQIQLSSWRVIVRLFQFQRPFPWRITLSILLSFCTVGANIGLMATSGYLIAKAALHPSTILLLWMSIIGVRFFGLSRAVFRYAERYFSHDLTFRILRQIRVWLYRRIEPLVPMVWQGRHSGDVLASAIGDIDTLQNFYLRAIAPPLVAFLAMGLCIVLMAPFGGDLVLALFAGLIAAAAGVPLLTHVLARRAGAESVQVRARMKTKLVDIVEGMADVLAYNLETKVMQEWEREQQIWTRRQLWLAHAGKSTLIRLLLRLWDPTNGHIELGGANLRDVEPEVVRRWFSVIEQKTYLFHESAADNLRLGHPAATLAELQDAASKSQIDQVLRALPEGYDTLLGEFGARLSVGGTATLGPGAGIAERSAHSSVG